MLKENLNKIKQDIEKYIEECKSILTKLEIAKIGRKDPDFFKYLEGIEDDTKYIEQLCERKKDDIENYIEDTQLGKYASLETQKKITNIIKNIKNDLNEYSKALTYNINTLKEINLY